MSVNRKRQDSKCLCCAIANAAPGSVVCEKCFHTCPDKSRQVISNALYNQQYPRPRETWRSSGGDNAA